jgi:outer membrane protein TolC
MLKSHWSRTLQQTAVLLCLGLNLHAGPAWADAAQLTDLETWARTSAPSVRLAQAEKDVAAHRADAARARQGGRLFGGATVGNAREAVTDTVSRSYQRAQVQAGVRWPLLGSREAQLRAVTEAEQGTAARQVRLRAIQQEAVQAVRQSYLRHLHGMQRIALTQAFLTGKETIEASLERRTNAGYMLPAERMGLSGLFSSTEALQRTLQFTAQSTLRELSRLTDRSITALDTAPMVWPDACTRAQDVLAQVDEHPSVQQARLEVDATDQIATHLRRETVEAGVSLSQSVSRDFGGQPGHSTTVGIDLSVPLEWKAHRDAMLGQLQIERYRAESQLELRRGEFLTAAELALGLRQVRQSDQSNAERLLLVAQENLRVAMLRQQRIDDGDAYAKVLNARYALLQAGLQWVEAAERLELATAELASWSATGCAQATTAPHGDSTLRPVLLTLMGNPFPQASTTRLASQQAGAGGPSPRTAEAHPALGWYVWNGPALLQAPSQLKALPPDTHRVLVSFTNHQLQALAQPPGQQRLTQLIAKAKQRGVRVELLLGEPTWALPEGRAQLLKLIKSVDHLPFNALHLDLERSQLPEADQSQWDQGVLDTVRAVRGVAPWPVALTTHYREFESPGFAQRLQEAGASEVTAMLYVSNTDRAVDIAQPLLQGPPGLKFSIAQSMERTLTAEESHFQLGKAVALQRWSALAKQLSALPHFSGVIVQSWEEFKEARP